MAIAHERNPMQTERRSPTYRGLRGAEFDACIVRKGVMVQHLASTPSAVEYLKSNDVDAGVIARVLSGRDVRRDDRAGAA
jgi:hypothetical protein